MTASTVFFLLFVLACPLMMMWMMRGGHGHGGGHSGHAAGCHGGHEHEDTPAESTDDLRRRREELDPANAEHEATEEHEPTPSGWGWDRR